MKYRCLIREKTKILRATVSRRVRTNAEDSFDFRRSCAKHSVKFVDQGSRRRRTAGASGDGRGTPMTKAQHANSTRRKRGGLWQLLILTMILGVGAAYLDKQGFDWNQQLAAIQGWYSYSAPVKQIETPTPAQ